MVSSDFFDQMTKILVIGNLFAETLNTDTERLSDLSVTSYSDTLRPFEYQVTLPSPVSI